MPAGCRFTDKSEQPWSVAWSGFHKRSAPNRLTEPNLSASVHIARLRCVVGHETAPAKGYRGLTSMDGRSNQPVIVVLHTWSRSGLGCWYCSVRSMRAPNFARCMVVSLLQPNEVAASELAVDRQIDQGKITRGSGQLKSDRNGPYVFEKQRSFLTDYRTMVQSLF